MSDGITGCLEITGSPSSPEGGILLGIPGGGVPPGSPNHDPISDQKLSFSTPVFRPVISAEKLLRARPLPNILGDPGASQSGRVKRRDESFQAWAEEPLGTDSHRTISKRSSECWLLIGHKKCFVLLCPIGEQRLLSSFREFVHDGY